MAARGWEGWRAPGRRPRRPRRLSGRAEGGEPPPEECRSAPGGTGAQDGLGNARDLSDYTDRSATSTALRLSAIHEAWLDTILGELIGDVEAQHAICRPAERLEPALDRIAAECCKIVVDAADPFFDRTLASRVFEAKGGWLDQAREALEEQLDSEDMQTIRGHAERQIESIRAQLREIVASTQMAAEDLEIYPPEPEIPGAEIDTDLQPQPLISSDWSWVEQSRALIARKRYGGPARAKR